MRFGLRKKDGCYDVIFLANGVAVGEVYQEVDGYYVYDPTQKPGALTEADLAGIAELLQFLNEPWSQSIDEYFSGQIAMFEVPWSELSQAAVQRMINGSTSIDT